MGFGTIVVIAIVITAIGTFIEEAMKKSKERRKQEILNEINDSEGFYVKCFKEGIDSLSTERMKDKAMLIAEEFGTANDESEVLSMLEASKSLAVKRGCALYEECRKQSIDLTHVGYSEKDKASAIVEHHGLEYDTPLSLTYYQIGNQHLMRHHIYEKPRVRKSVSVIDSLMIGEEINGFIC